MEIGRSGKPAGVLGKGGKYGVDCCRVYSMDSGKWVKGEEGVKLHKKRNSIFGGNDKNVKRMKKGLQIIWHNAML